VPRGARLPRRGRLPFRRRLGALGLTLGGDRRLPRLGCRDAKRLDDDRPRWAVKRVDERSGYVVPVHLSERRPPTKPDHDVATVSA
jgi:hypothetical protein